MRKLLLILGAIISVAQANAAETVYAPAPDTESSGLSFTRTSDSQPDIFATGRAFGANLGYGFGNGFRAELENLNSYSNRSGLSQGLGGVNSNSVMLHGLYEFDNGNWWIKPFIGAGIGMVDVNAGLLGVSASDRVTAYQLRGGVNYAISQKLVGSVGYNWVKGQTPQLSLRGVPAKLAFPSGGIFVGLNYKLR